MKLALLLTCFGALGFAQNTPVRTVDSGCPFASNQLVPSFRSGYCFRIDTALAYGPNGQIAFAVHPQLPGGDQASILDIAVDGNGGFVAAAVSATARGLVLLDQYGVQNAFIPTRGFYPSHVTVSEDHSIWVVANGGGKVVRRYSSSGQETGSFLPVSSFPASTINPGTGGHGTAIMAGGGIVAVVARSGSGSNTNGDLRELIRMDYSGKVLSRSRFDDVSEQVLAMTSDGNLYRGDNVPSLPVYRLDANTQTWEQVSKPAGVAALFGADGPTLVYRSFDGAERTRIQWYAQPADRKSELEVRP